MKLNLSFDIIWFPVRTLPMSKSQGIPVSKDIKEVEEGEGHGVLLEPGLHVVQLGVQALPLNSWEKARKFEKREKGVQCFI